MLHKIGSYNDMLCKNYTNPFPSKALLAIVYNLIYSTAHVHEIKIQITKDEAMMNKKKGLWEFGFELNLKKMGDE